MTTHLKLFLSKSIKYVQERKHYYLIIEDRGVAGRRVAVSVIDPSNSRGLCASEFIHTQEVRSCVFAWAR